MSILERRITTLADIRLAAIADRATIVIQAEYDRFDVGGYLFAKAVPRFTDAAIVKWHQTRE